VVADLLPDPPERRRRIPQGVLIGFAAAIKLTPALFVIFMFLIGKRRAAITAIISFAVFTGIGAILLFRETVVLSRRSDSFGSTGLPGRCPLVA
jgi:alpha-1,2-mannosyltransferase